MTYLTYEKVEWKDYPSNATLLTAENLKHMDEGIKAATEKINELQGKLEDIADIVYPVGSIYLSISNVSPGTLFGGIWTRFAIGRTLIGISPDDSDFSNVEVTGGSKGKKIQETNLPSHTHSFVPEGKIEEVTLSGNTNNSMDAQHDHSYSYPQLTFHEEIIYYQKGNADIHLLRNVSKKSEVSKTEISPVSHRHHFELSHSHNFTGVTKETKATGESTELDILPPYVTCYIWKRIK